MKILYLATILTLSMHSIGNDFGDMRPAPSLGNKWEMLTLGSGNPTKLQIVSIEGLNVTTRMKGEDFEIFSTSNYIIKDGVCYTSSTESYNALSKSTYYRKKEFSPPLRCEIHTSEMPYHEVYTTTIYDFNSNNTTVEKRDRMYYYRGTEKVTTPAGEYTAQKIEVNGEKMNRFYWKNEENSLIKHQVKYAGEKEASMTVLHQGVSQ